MRYINLEKLQYKHSLFPLLLLLKEQLPTWAARADCLNNNGVLSSNGKRWTANNLRMFFADYWNSSNGLYSWTKEEEQLQKLKAVFTA